MTTAQHRTFLVIKDNGGTISRQKLYSTLEHEIELQGVRNAIFRLKKLGCVVQLGDDTYKTTGIEPPELIRGAHKGNPDNMRIFRYFLICKSWPVTL